MPPNSRRRSVPDPFPRRWPKITLIAACLAVAGAGWWFYGDDAERWFYGQDAERQGDETLSPGVQAGEAPAKLEQAAKPTELKQAEFLSAAYREALEKERRRNTELEQDSANDHQLLAQERERSKGLEQQLSARQNDQQLLAQERERNRGPQQLQQQQQQQLAALQPRQELPAQPEGVKPQPTVRRTGPRPLPNVTQPMPPFTLQASDLTHNPARYWQVTVTLTSNTSRTLDAQIRCSFLNAERSVAEASFGPTTVAPGEQISADLIGPPITAYVVSTTCRLVGQ